MVQAPSTASIAPAGVSVEAAATSYRLHVKAKNLSPLTVAGYGESLHQFDRYLQAQGMPRDIALITREHVEHFLAALLEKRKSSTTQLKYRHLTSFFGWLKEEHEIAESPMANVKPPKITDEAQPAVLRDDALRALLGACSGRTFQDRRDLALLSIFVDTGGRLSEVANLRLVSEEGGDVDLEGSRLYVLGKGRRPRPLSIGAKTVTAIDRYLRVRQAHPSAGSPFLWVGHKGKVSPTGVRQIVKRRALEAGLGDIFPHQLRHSFAHVWLASGEQESALMEYMGWRSRTMLQRYAKSVASERAMDAHKRLSPMDRL